MVCKVDDMKEAVTALLNLADRGAEELKKMVSIYLFVAQSTLFIIYIKIHVVIYSSNSNFNNQSV